MHHRRACAVAVTLFVVGFVTALLCASPSVADLPAADLEADVRGTFVAGKQCAHGPQSRRNRQHRLRGIPYDFDTVQDTATFGGEVLSIVGRFLVALVPALIYKFLTSRSKVVVGSQGEVQNWRALAATAAAADGAATASAVAATAVVPAMSLPPWGLSEARQVCNSAMNTRVEGPSAQQARLQTACGSAGGGGGQNVTTLAFHPRGGGAEQLVIRLKVFEERSLRSLKDALNGTLGSMPHGMQSQALESRKAQLVTGYLMPADELNDEDARRPQEHRRDSRVDVQELFEFVVLGGTLSLDIVDISGVCSKQVEIFDISDGECDTTSAGTLAEWLSRCTLAKYIHLFARQGYDDLAILRDAHPDDINELIAYCEMPRVHSRIFEFELQQLLEGQVSAAESVLADKEMKGQVRQVEVSDLDLQDVEESFGWGPVVTDPVAWWLGSKNYDGSRQLDDGLRTWLHGNRLSKYELLFVENGYDDLQALSLAGPVEIDRLVVRCDMPPGHARHFGRALERLRCDDPGRAVVVDLPESVLQDTIGHFADSISAGLGMTDTAEKPEDEPRTPPCGSQARIDYVDRWLAQPVWPQPLLSCTTA